MDRNASVFAGVAILAVLLLGATGAVMAPNPQALSSTLTTTASAGSANQLVLRFTMNASVVPSGRGVALTLGEWNSLDARNDVPSSNSWPIEGLGTGPCGPLSYPFGFEVLSGYYSDSAGLNSAQKIQLYAPGPYYCPAILGGITGYSFYPLSDRANITGPCGGGASPCVDLEMNMTTLVSEEWTGSSMVPLPAGTYTVVAGDEWGALLFGHFEVTSSAPGGTVILPAGTTLQVSSSFDCVAGHYSVPFSMEDPSLLSGGFSTSGPGVTLYVATAQQASNVSQGHPSAWTYSTGLQNSTHFAVSLGAGSYVAWIEGADLNCGATVVIPLEELTSVNITQAFILTDTLMVTTTASSG